MPRLRRRVVATRKVAVRHTETPTRTLCKRTMDEMLSDEMLKRGFRVSTSRPVWNDLETEVLYWEYDITALI